MDPASWFVQILSLPQRLVYVAIVAGHLVRFRVKPGSALHNAAKQRISLLDAYVLSGYFAAMNLPKGEFMANAPAAPRRYVDGLETDDGFLIGEGPTEVFE